MDSFVSCGRSCGTFLPLPRFRARSGRLTFSACAFLTPGAGTASFFETAKFFASSAPEQILAFSVRTALLTSRETSLFRRVIFPCPEQMSRKFTDSPPPDVISFLYRMTLVRIFFTPSRRDSLTLPLFAARVRSFRLAPRGAPSGGSRINNAESPRSTSFHSFTFKTKIRRSEAARFV